MAADFYLPYVTGRPSARQEFEVFRTKWRASERSLPKGTDRSVPFDRLVKESLQAVPLVSPSSPPRPPLVPPSSPPRPPRPAGLGDLLGPAESSQRAITGDWEIVIAF